MRLPVHGGPADGAMVAETAGIFRWIDAGRQQGFTLPRPGRALYRCRSVGGSWWWEFTGEECWRCECGSVVVERSARCPLCGVERVKREVMDGDGNERREGVRAG